MKKLTIFMIFLSFTIFYSCKKKPKTINVITVFEKHKKIGLAVNNLWLKFAKLSASEAEQKKFLKENPILFINENEKISKDYNYAFFSSEHPDQKPINSSKAIIQIINSLGMVSHRNEQNCDPLLKDITVGVLIPDEIGIGKFTIQIIANNLVWVQGTFERF